jgi:hypothetical protein
MSLVLEDEERGGVMPMVEGKSVPPGERGGGADL